MNSETLNNLVSENCGVDRSEYSELVKTSVSRVFAVCLGIVGNRVDAEDIAQQAFLKGYLEIGKLRDGHRFEPWIVRIAKNLCIDFFRREKRAPTSLYEAVDNGSKDSKEYPGLTKALAKLPQQYRVILLLYYFDGQNAESIAGVLDTSQRAVHTRMCRARKQLRQILEADGDVL